jgi:hypothetical protein
MPSLFDLQEPLSQFTAVATKNVAGTLTAPEVIAGLILSAPASGVTLNSPTATAIADALKAAKPGTAFDFTIRNTGGGNFAVTFAAGDGVTITGTATVASGKVGAFRGVVTATATPAVTFYRVGTSDI